MLREVVSAVVVLTAALIWYVLGLIKKRSFLDGLPQPPMQNRLIGHLHIAGELAKIFPKSVHTHVWPDWIRTRYDMPEVFYMDWRPFGPLWLHVADPELASTYLTTAQSLPKSSLETDYMMRFLGDQNLVSLEGQRWKSLRSIFNPGFSAANIMTMTDVIVDSSLTFCDVLREKARTNENFELEEYATRLTIDIIGRVTLDADMQAQQKLHPIVKYFRERVPMMPAADAVFPWQDVQPLRPLRLWWNARQLNKAISDELDLKIERRGKDIEEEEKGTAKGLKKKSVVDLALNTWEKEMGMSGDGSTKSQGTYRILSPNDLPSELRQDLIDQVKTFFFAGHDTTSSTITWLHYLLHRNPHVQEKLAAELDLHFPPGTDAAQAIRKEPHIINKLEYTTAVIKETMRIFPPASTLRAVDLRFRDVQQDKKFITDPKTGAQYPLEGAHIWPVAHMIMRNRRFFPQPTHFIPERFIQSQTPFPDAELFTPAGKDAWRPFEKGPRSCIGQELAMIETKIIVALTAREFDFVLEYPGEEVDPQYPIPDSTVAEFDDNTEYGRGIRNGSITPLRVEGHRLWPTLKGSAKPNGGAPGRIRMRAVYS